MSQNSYPKVDAPFSDHEWKNLFLTLGRGVIDKGGSPYKLTSKDSVTNTVTIGVDTRDGQNFAVLDGFLHTMDAPEQVSVPAVTTDTTYEIGLVYDPNQHGAEGGPITLTAWTTPADNTGGKSRMVLYRMTRKNNLALGSTPHTAEVPRAVPVISVSQVSQLPTNSLVLVDSIGVVRTTGEFYRADIDESGTVSWTQVGGSGSDTSGATTSATPNTIVKRGWDGSFLVGESNAASSPTTKSYVDNRASWSGLPGKPSSFNPSSHTHKGTDITTSIPYDVINGSEMAYNNTNLGSTWTTVAANSTGRFGRYPSALKYKKNVRQWALTPETVYGITPVKYEDVQNGDTRVGVVADSYVNSLPELVESNPDTGEVEGWRYMLMCVAQQVAIRDLNNRLKTKEQENETLAFNQQEILAYLGLNTDDTGRVITDQNGAV